MGTANLVATTPIKTNADFGSEPSVPSGMKVSCMADPGNVIAATSCPVMKWGDLTYWAFSYTDNSLALGIVAFDSSGAIVKQWEKSGARYVYNITVDSSLQTVTFWGQNDRSVTMSWADLENANAYASIVIPAFSIGSHPITAQYSGDFNHISSISASSALTVLNTLTGIGFNQPISVQAGKSVSSVVYAAYADLTTPTLTSGVTYSSGDPTIATVDPTTGMITGIAAGESTVISAAYQGFTAQANVTVTAAPIESITVSSSSGTMYIGASLQFSATVAPDLATDKTFSWSVVPGTGAATINAAGRLVATKAGTITVQATAHDGSGVIGSKVITIHTRSLPAVTTPVIDLNGLTLDPNTIDTTKPSVTLEVTPKDGAAFISIPASILTSFESKNAAFVIELKTSYGSYQVPVNLTSLIPGLKDLLAKNNVTNDDISFKITLTDKSGDKDIQAALTNGLPNGQAIGAIVDFHMDIINTKTGQAIGTADKFSQALTRVIPMSKSVTSMPVQWGAFRYNAATEKLEFVAAEKKQIDGVWVVIMSSYSNSVYVVARNTVSFADVQQHWSKSDVELAAAKGLVEGVGDGKYDPNKAVTRAEFTAMLVRALGRGTSDTGMAPYDDVESGTWYSGEVATAKELGLLAFVKGNRFSPNQPLTREEMASMLAAVARLEQLTISSEPVSLDGFKDIGNADADYLEDVRLMVKLHIMTGTGATTFDPKGKTTRAQAATVFIRALQALGMIDS
ncbi:S-layer homology domain-containing protein [Paenibacillus rhizovicinus]|uniref:S-layer homology domain-containing protein n=1 Tax=Paenibacillus rhizovicinus TaxID=2704463 RepID=UPI001CDC92EB|nr:S-layer homology domain-containing protein [Paenibacillus rhizovicinus]